jgi:F-type H+-transporting ATPase subunit epsilon
VEEKILLEIVTPEKSLIKEEAEEVTAPGEEGEFGVLPGHTPFMTILKTGEIKYGGRGGSYKYLAVNNGFAEVMPNRVYVLVETAEKAEEIDLQRAEAARDRAEERIQNADKEEIDFARAQAALKRALARLQVITRVK